jgi:formate hydrogenlyase subunit 3/multisubunit Na+/H+ antiporter MnhD subunit
MSRENLPTLFLKVGGAVLLLLGIVGYIGVTNNVNFFNLDAGENLAHSVLGIVALGFGFFVKDQNVNKWLVVIVGVVALIFGVLGFFLANGDFMAGHFAHPNFFGLANLENPADNLLHLVVGIVALLAVYFNRPAMAPAR